MAAMTGTVAPAETTIPAPGPSRLFDRLRQADPNWWLVASMVGTFVVVFVPLVHRRHANFSSFNLDMGIFDQTIWLLAHGETFITTRGMEFFGHHASPALLLLVPFYWLGAGAHFINAVQVLSLALGAVPVFLLGRDRLGHGWMALALAAVYLLHPAFGFLAWELFHPEVMAIPALLFAWWFASRQRWGWYAASLIYHGGVEGGRRPRRHRHRHPRRPEVQPARRLVTAGAALVWFVFVTRVMLPAVAGEVFYGQLYQGIGQTPAEIARGAIDDPGNITGRLVNGEARSYLWQLLAPFGFFPLVGLPALIGGPQLLANLLSDYVWTREIRVHYAALPLAGLTLGMVEGVELAAGRRLRRPRCSWRPWWWRRCWAPSRGASRPSGGLRQRLLGL